MALFSVIGYRKIKFYITGVVPFVGEIGDTAKLARTADKAVDAAKAINKTTDGASVLKKSISLPKPKNSKASHIIP